MKQVEVLALSQKDMIKLKCFEKGYSATQF